MQIFNYACLIAASTAISLTADTNAISQYGYEEQASMTLFKEICGNMVEAWKKNQYSD